MKLVETVKGRVSLLDLMESLIHWTLSVSHFTPRNYNCVNFFVFKAAGDSLSISPEFEIKIEVAHED